MTNELYLSAVYIYPVKGLGGVAASVATVEERGLQHDRRWMLVDSHNRFLSQRVLPQMALLQAAVTDELLQITHKQTGQHITVPQMPQTADLLQVQVWDDTCDAVAVSPEADAFFSDYLDTHCRLVYMPDSSVRPVDERYAVADNYTSFSDAYPFLLIGQASLDDLNGRLEEALPMNRFRPNLVVSGADPYAEESWREIRIGECRFYGVKPCARCVVTTTNQDTAQVGKEPLRTLATYHKTGKQILFGQNMVFGREGVQVKIGDQVSVLSFNDRV